MPIPDAGRYVHSVRIFKAIGGGDVASGLLNRFITVKSEIGAQMSHRRLVSKISVRLAA